MTYTPDIHNRHSIRMREYDYSQAGLYFITICAQNHECIFGRIVEEKMQLNEFGENVKECWLEIPQHYQRVILHNFIVMPNHLHGIIEIISNVGVEYFRPEKDVIADTRVEKDVIVDTRVEKDVIVDTRVEKDVIVDTRVEKDVIVDTRVEKYVIVDTRVENIRPLRERPNCESGSIGAIVRGFKIGITKKIGYSVWQRNYYEHIIHSSNDYARIVDYIENNPARWEVDKLYKG